MTQNRNKLIDLFIGNISNSIVHEILEKAIANEEIADKYGKELTTSLEIAKSYREKINPINTFFPDKDLNYIKTKIKNKVRAELLIRVSKGYKNINLELVEEMIDKYLKNMNVIN
jgi:hypothetical protein